MGLLQGASTGTNLSRVNVSGMGLNLIIKLSQAYGTEVGVGGAVDWKRGSIDMKQSTQSYDLQALWGDVVESGSRIEIKKIFHNAPPAAARIYDPFSMTGMSYSNILNEMGMGGFSPATQFLMCPIFEDLLRMQAIEFNDQVRKSHYSFELVNNKLRIFPIPTYDTKLYFDYVVAKDRDQQAIQSSSYYYLSGSSWVTGSIIRDYANIPYNIIPYADINEVGKQWIRKYFLALCKEVLGIVRQKYQTIPIPGAEISLDGGELRQEAANEKEKLIAELRENLLAVSRGSIMELQASMADQLQNSLNKIPMLIYVA